VHNTDADRLSGLLTLDAADQLLTSSAIRTPAVRLARDGAVLPESAYTRGASLAGKRLTGLVDPRKALALFGEGATVVFQGLHRYWEPIADLVATLELELGHPCQANAYLTPPGAQGFAVHSDGHDVFVFQTHGSKQWEIHNGDAADGVEDVLLVPGLSMYLPTGTPHAARAQEDVSLHVTIGINQLTWRGLVERAVRPLLDGVDDGHLPAGYLDDTTELSAGLAARLTGLAEAVARLDVGAATAGEVDRFLTGRNPRLRGGVSDVLATRNLEDGTRLRRRPGHPCVLRSVGERLVVLIGDRSLEMPAWLRPAMEVVQSSTELRPADLAPTGLDETSRLVLCRRLVREGLLEASG
jgi:lysine-specific demethylase/histidyl-hydroxylase NO66